MDKKYSEHLDTIVALVSHLAMTEKKSRTPQILSKYLSLEPNEVSYVLKNFKGLFRESINLSSTQEHYYTLQVRYALRWKTDNQIPDDPENDDPDLRLPLGSDYLSSLLDFISNIVGQELTSKRQGLQNTIAIVVAVIALVGSPIATYYITMANSHP